MTTANVRRATHDDYEDVVAFTAETWSEREEGDYLPDVFHDWVDGDGEDQKTAVVDVNGTAVGVCQGKVLTEYEGWLQGMRVDPEYRGAGYGMRLVGHLFEWASERGATVARNLVFGWNDAGLGQSVASGFSPRASFRWVRPDPRDVEPAKTVSEDAAAAWSYWARSDARDVLGGLALDRDEPWAVSELTRTGLADLAADQRVFAVEGNGTQGMAARVRTTEFECEDGSEQTMAEYGVGAWADDDAAEALLAAIRADAHDLGVDATRVLVPESPRHVAEAAAVRADCADGPEFVLEADLTGAT